MRALCAVRVSLVSRGIAAESICSLLAPTLVCCTTATLVIRWPTRVTWTCMGPYWVFATAPVTVRVAVEPAVPLGFPAELAGAVTPLAVGAAAALGAAGAVEGAAAAGVAAAALPGSPSAAGLPGTPATGMDVPGVPTAETPELTGWVLNDSSAARPAMVPPRVRTARRMRFLRFPGRRG